MSDNTPRIIDVSSPPQVALLRRAALKFSGVSQAEAFVEAPGSLALVAVDGDDVLGWCWGHLLMRPDRSSMVYLHGFEVVVEHRRRGIGRCLLTAFMTTARDAGASKMFLLTAEANEPACRLYESLGGEPPAHGPTSIYWFHLR